MLGRGFFGILTGIGLLIAIGLILTHGNITNQLAQTTFGGVDTIIRDLQLQPQHGTH
jgi:hypothetical protein